MSNYDAWVILLAGILIGIFLFMPLCHIIARRSDDVDADGKPRVDRSNVFNTVFVICLAVKHMGKLHDLRDSNGKHLFNFMHKDLFKGILGLWK